MLISRIPPLLLLPNELLSNITDFLTNPECAKLLTTCTRLYPFLVKRLYRRIEIYQHRPHYRLPLIALASRRTRVDDYAVYTQYFSFTGDIQTDDFLVFPILCLCLYRMDNLLELGISITRQSSSFLLQCLEKYRVINQHLPIRGLGPSRNTRCVDHVMTGLRSLRIRLDADILSICACRQITSLTLTGYLGYYDIEDVISKLEDMTAGRRITDLSLRLQPSVEVEQIIRTIGDAMPSLKLLSLNRARLNPMAILQAIASPSYQLHMMRSLHFNVRSIVSPLKALSITDRMDAINNHIEALGGASKNLSRLEFIQFGPLQWRRGGSDETWSPKPMTETMGWWLETFGDHRVSPVHFSPVVNQIIERWFRRR